MICTYTIMGDVSQNIHFGYGLNDWEELKALFFLQVRDRKELIGKAAGICRKWQEKGLDTIAVVLRDRQSAETVAEELGQYIEVIDSDLEKAVFGSGIMVLPVEYTKGLEFDAVLILDPDRQDYPVDDGHAKLLYVAATRALHELCVLHTENLTGLIAEPIPERAEESRCQDLRHETEVKRERDKQEKEKQKISEYIERLEKEAQDGRKYREELTFDITKLFLLAMPDCPAYIVSDFCRSQNTDTLIRLKSSLLKKQSSAFPCAPQTAKKSEKTRLQSDNDYMI